MTDSASASDALTENTAPPAVDSEQERLEVLNTFEILDTPQDDRFDRLTKIASESFSVPISLISLIDDCRQWFKSAQGLDVPETPREWAFCDYAIRQRDVMVVEDAAADPRFQNNPLVTGEPHIRFYAGAPLISRQGAALGTLCVIGPSPRQITPSEKERLEDLAALAVNALDAHLLRESTKSVRSALEEMEKIAARTVPEFQAYAREILDFGCTLFGCDQGFVGRIRGDQYRLLGSTGQAETADGPKPKPLKETLSAITAAEKKPVALHNISGDPKLHHPALPKTPVKSYIAAPLKSLDHVFGTISFVGRAAKPRPFADWERYIISRMAENISAGQIIETAQTSATSARDEVQMILDNVPAKIWYKDDKNTILRTNLAAARSMGVDDPADLENADSYDLFPDMAEKYHKDDLAVIESGEALRDIVEAYTPLNGTPRWVSTDKIPLRTSKGENTLLVVATDITELKTREKQLEQLNQSLKDFSFVAAHDLQAPLRQAGMFAELFREHLADDGITLSQDAEDLLEGVTAGLQKMRSMVRSLHNLSRLESEDFDFSDVDLNTVVKDALDRIDFPNKTIKTFDSATLPNVQGTEDLLIQIFQNLFINACKYTPGEQITIRIGYNRDPSKLAHIISIEDEGRGIPRDAHERVFEPFQRLHHSSEIEGTGIGLALCRRIAHLHRGTITIDPTYTTGTRFLLQLPSS